MMRRPTVGDDDLATSPPVGSSRMAVDSAEFPGVSSSPSFSPSSPNAPARARLIAEFNDAIEKGDTLGAIQKGNELLKLNPRDAKVLANRGAAYEAAGRPLDALSDWNAALSVDPYNVQSLVGKGNLLVSQGRFNEALPLLQSATENDPHNAHAVHSLAIAAAQNGDHERAVESEQKVIDMLLNPNSLNPISGAPVSLAETYYNKGWNLSRLGEYVPAIECFTAALNIDPLMAKAFNSRGHAKKNLNQWREALEDFIELSRIDPLNYKAFHQQALCHHQLGDLHSAIACDTESINIRDNFPARYNRSIAYAQLGMLQEAMDDLNVAIQMEPNDYMALCNRGILHIAFDNIPMALADLDKSISIQPTVIALNARALLHYQNHNIPQALADWNLSIQIDPSFPALLHRGNHYLSDGQPEIAIDDFTHALSLVPPYEQVPALVNRSAGLLMLAKFHECIADCDRALSIDPHNAQAMHNKALALQALGMYEEAMKWHQAALNEQPDNEVYQTALRDCEAEMRRAAEEEENRKTQEEMARLMKEKMLGEERERKEREERERKEAEERERQRNAPIDYSKYAPLSAEQARQLAEDEGLTGDELEFLREYFPFLLAQLTTKDGKLRLTDEMKRRLAEYRERLKKYPVLKKWGHALAACLDTSTYDTKAMIKQLRAV